MKDADTREQVAEEIATKLYDDKFWDILGRPVKYGRSLKSYRITNAD